MFFYFPATPAPAACDNPTAQLQTRYIVVTQGTTHYVASVFSSLLIAEALGSASPVATGIDLYCLMHINSKALAAMSCQPGARIWGRDQGAGSGQRVQVNQTSRVRPLLGMMLGAGSVMGHGEAVVVGGG